jgi:hypothetical protein
LAKRATAIKPMTRCDAPWSPIGGDHRGANQSRRSSALASPLGIDIGPRPEQDDGLGFGDSAAARSRAMGKFTDDVPLREEGSVQPPNAELLIRKLEVEKAAIDVQSKAITRWLATNDPGPSLERSLGRHGFGGSLKKRGGSASGRATA